MAQYLRCPLQYYFERVLKLVRPTQPAALVLGAAVHEVLADYHRSLIAPEPLSAHTLGDRFIAAWKVRAEERPLQLRDGESIRDLIDQGVALVELYRRQPQPPNILAVEEKLTVPLVNSAGRYLERPLVAIVDLIRTQGTTTRAVEFKTGGRRYGPSEVATALQATCYAHAIHEYFGTPASVEYVVLVKTNTPAIQRLKTTRMPEDAARLGDLCQTVGRAIQQQLFYPIESPQNCATCSFPVPCRAWRGRAIPCRSEIRLHPLENRPSEAAPC